MKKVVLVIVAIILIVAAGVGGWFLGNSQVKVEVKEKEVSSAKVKTYADLKGSYESQEINLNAGTNLSAHNVNYRLILSNEGTFAAYYLNGDTDCHYVGYYTISESKITFNCVVLTGNDPSANLDDAVFEMSINEDGTIEDKDHVKFTKKSETPSEDTNIAKTINKYLGGNNATGPWFSGLNK